MSMQTFVFYKKHKQPTLEQLQAEITASGFDYQLPKSFELDITEPNFTAGVFESLESGFDYLQDEYDNEDWEWDENDIKILNCPEVLSVFNTYSNAQEIVAMLIVSSVLAKITDGVMLSDFFEDELIRSENCVEFAKSAVENSRDQFSGPSKMRA